MSMGDTGTQRQVNTTIADPYTESMRMRNVDYAENTVNNNPMVAPLSTQTMNGISLLNQGAAGVGASAQGALAGIQGRQGAGGNASTTLNLATPGMQDNPWGGLLGSAGASQTTAGVQQLADTARGGAMNPYLNSVYRAASRPVMDDVNAQFAKSGRYASGAHTGVMTDRLGDMAASIYAPAYENERNRQLSAANSWAGIQQNDRAANMAGIQGAGAMYSDDASRRLQGASLYGNMANQDVANAQRDTAMLPSIWAGIMAPGNAAMQGGQVLDAYNQSLYDAPYTQAQWLNQQRTGLPDFSGSTSVSRTRSTPGLASILGGGLQTAGAMGWSPLG